MGQLREWPPKGTRRHACRGALLMIAFVTVTSGCSSHHSRSVLYQGPSPGLTRVTHRISDAAARHNGDLVQTQWEREIRKRAREAPREHFANLPPAILRQRLREAADGHGFEVDSVKLLRPRQLAPEITVHTTDYLGLTHALPRILRGLDPHHGGSDAQGWSYEGFLIVARDERGIPFLAVYNYWRGQHKGGGQWARSEALFPFQHG